MTAVGNADALRRNRVLAGLDADTFGLMRSVGEPVDLSAGESLYRIGEPIEFVYFPFDGLVALVHPTSGGPVDVGVIGSEGVVGLSVLLGARRALGGAVVRAAGRAARVSVGDVAGVARESETLRESLLLYASTLVAQLGQLIACAREHTIAQRLCTLLVVAGTDDVVITQEAIGRLLGARRASVNEAAVALQRSGVIACRRGRITVVDRAGLECSACECSHHADGAAEFSSRSPLLNGFGRKPRARRE